MEELVNLLATDSSAADISDKMKNVLFTKAAEKIDANGNVGHEVLQFKDVLLKDLEHLAGDKTILSATATRIRKHKI